MNTTLTVRLSDKEAKALQAVCKKTGKSRSELVREALRQELFRTQLQALRATVVPKARAAGWMSEEDVFREVS
jgi:predicted transcriptional regulator